MIQSQASVSYDRLIRARGSFDHSVPSVVVQWRLEDLFIAELFVAIVKCVLLPLRFTGHLSFRVFYCYYFRCLCAFLFGWEARQ